MAALQPKMCPPNTLEKAPPLITMKTGASGGKGKAGVPRPTPGTSEAGGEGCEPTLLLLQATHSHGELQEGLGTDRLPTPKKSYQDHETILAVSLSTLLQHEPLPSK